MSERIKDVPSVPSGLDRGLRDILQSLRENVRAMRGFTKGGVSAIGSGGGGGVIGTGGGVTGPGGGGTSTGPDMTAPPMPSGVSVSSSFTTVFIETDPASFTQGHGYGRTIVYGAKYPGTGPLPTFSDAVVVHEFVGEVGSFSTELGTQWHVWVAWRSIDGVNSVPEGGTNGHQTTTGKVGNADLGPLIVEAANLAAGAVDTTKFVAGIAAVEILAALPGSGNFDGRMVFLTTDKKLYRYDSTGAVWTSEVSATDIAGQITSTQITDGAISTPKLAAGAVTANELAANSVVAGKLAANAIAVGTAAVQNGAITNAMIGNLAVDSAKIADGAIVTAKIADANITTAKIANAAVGSAQIASASVGTAHIVDANVTTAKIADANITTAKIASAAVGSAQIADAAITTAKIGTAQVGTLQVAGNAITAPAGARLTSGVNLPADTLTTLLAITIDPGTSPVFVFAQLQAQATAARSGASSVVAILDAGGFITSTLEKTDGMAINDTKTINLTFYDDRGLSGSRTYTLQANQFGTGTIKAASTQTAMFGLGTKR